MRIICDFDGTISRHDTTDLVLERLAASGWMRLEDDWVAARITAAECMRGQIALIGGDREALNAVLDEVELDPGFTAFVAWCEARRLPVSIASDGVDAFIDRVLTRHGLERLPVVANRLAGAAGGWRLEQPWSRTGCAAASGVCKCAAAGAWSGEAWPLTVYVGDGRSDFCVAGRADILFAKGALAEYAADRAQPFIPYETFDDVTRALVRILDMPSAADRAAAL